MARSSAYFIADPQVKQTFLAWNELREKNVKELVGLAFVCNPAISGSMPYSHISPVFAEHAERLQTPPLEIALGFRKSYDWVPTEGGFLTLPEMRGESLGNDIVLIVGCNAQGRPVYDLPESCKEISEREYRDLRHANAGAAGRIFYRLADRLAGF